MPLIRGRKFGGTAQSQYGADYGDSIFRANRGLYDKRNFLMSTMLHLAALARNRAHTYTSRDGSGRTDTNPYLEGTQVQLKEGEKLELLPLLETGRDLNALIGLVAGELQRGSLPYTVYGELSLAISGYAIKLLTQGIDTPMGPLVKAMESAYLQICSLLMDQYVSGAYEPMSLSGRGNNRQWFDEIILPESLMGVGTPEVTLRVDVPQDDAAKMQVAQLARQGPVPLLPDIYLRDQILGVENADLVADQINEQMAERLLPEATLLSLAMSARERGRMDLFILYAKELEKMNMMGLLPQVPSQVSGGRAGAGGGNGMSPETLPPREAQGLPPYGPEGPPAQAGPLVPPGTPRPGAQANP